MKEFNQWKILVRWAAVFSIIVFLFAIVGGYFILQAGPVQGAGSSNITCNVTGQNDCVWWDNSAAKTWSDLVTSTDIRQNEQNVIRAGWHDSLASGKWHGNWAGMIFDTSNLPAGAEVKNITLRLKVNHMVDDNPEWFQFYAVYTGSSPDDSMFDGVDEIRWWYEHEVARISHPISQTSFNVGDWLEFKIGKYGGNDGISYILDDDNDLVVLYLMTTNHALMYAPIPLSYEDWKWTAWYGWGSEYEPELVFECVTPAATRTVVVPENAAVDDETDGTELVTSVNWTTPRTMYADDDCLVVQVVGESGARFTGALVSEAGTTLEVVDDSVRTNGYYYWEIDDIDSYSGFVRAWALTDNTTNQIYSKWAHIALAPDVDQRTNDIYSLSTEYPQYDNEFSDYVVQEGDLMFVHWKTNIDGATELADYMLCLRDNGDYYGLAYWEILDVMHDSYFEGSEANAQALLHWRYAIFTMDDTGAGWNSYNGLVINLNKPLISGNKGFYQPVLLDTTDNVTLLCETHSSYWYLDNASEGILMSLDKSTYKQDDDITASVVLGKAGRVYNTLPDFMLTTIGAESYSAGGTVLLGNNSFELKGVASGEYDARFTFQGGGVENYVYIHDIHFTVGEVAEDGVIPEGAGDIIDNVTEWLEQYGLDNPAGHWLIMIIAMVILFVVSYKSELLRVVFPLLVLGICIIIQWVDTWVVVLLALGAGLSIYSLFRRKAQGGGEG